MSPSRKLLFPPLISNTSPLFSENSPAFYILCVYFPPTLTMMHLCITQCTYWTPLSLGGYVLWGFCPTENRRGFCPGELLSGGLLFREDFVQGLLSWTPLSSCRQSVLSQLTVVFRWFKRAYGRGRTKSGDTLA